MTTLESTYSDPVVETHDWEPTEGDLATGEPALEHSVQKVEACARAAHEVRRAILCSHGNTETPAWTELTHEGREAERRIARGLLEGSADIGGSRHETLTQAVVAAAAAYFE